MFKSKIKAAFLLMPPEGATLEGSITEAFELRKTFKGTVLLQFNSVILEIADDSTEDSVYRFYTRLSNNKESW